MIPFYGDLLTPHVGCIQTALTVVAVTQNVCMSRRWKAELVAYISRKLPLPSFTLLSLKPDHSVVCPISLGSVQYLVLTSKSRSYQTVQ
jgi:hypothetical protein